MAALVIVQEQQKLQQQIYRITVRILETAILDN